MRRSGRAIWVIAPPRARPMADTLLELKGVETRYGLSQVLFGVSFSIERGKVVTLMGRNGMGKTTTVRSIMGLTPARAGSIRFDEREIRGLASYRVAQLGIGLVPEGRQIFPNLTVKENLLATAADRRESAPPWTLDRVYAIFPQLSDLQGRMGIQLSGGEQQMLAVGRALMTNPRLLILDEATEGLAPLIREEIWRCLAQLKAEGLSILIIDKNVEDLIRIADRHYLIERGRIVWDGNSEALTGAPDIQHRYLGV
jgi:branched-chain amino acid transport system ATP-binding protein